MIIYRIITLPVFFFNCLVGDWYLTASFFNQKAITSIESNQWTNPLNGAHPMILQCGYNDIQLIVLDGYHTQIYHIITNMTPHYELKIIVDLSYYKSIDLNEFGDLWIDSQQIFIRTLYSILQRSLYFNTCPLDDPYAPILNAYTIISSISHFTQAAIILLTTNLNSPYQDEAYAFRNLQIWIKPCPQTCLTCNSNSCITCHYQTPTSGSCGYCSDPNFQFTHAQQGCIQECSNEHSIADQNNLCIYDERITSIFECFQATTFTFSDFILQEGSITGNAKIETCSSQSIAGQFYYQDQLIKMVNIPTSTTLLRLRISFFFFGNWNDQEEMLIQFNGVTIASLYYNSGTANARNTKIINSLYAQSCGSQTYDLIRIEQLIPLDQPLSQILISFQASLNPLETHSWGMREVNLSAKSCSQNCETCENEDNCQSCQSGFKLHKGQCLSECPSYSIELGTVCSDFDEETEMTIYQIKEFYDLTTDDETANTMFTLVSQNSPNFEKGPSIYFSYLDNQRIFGGTLVWRNAKFQKIFTVTEPHYQITLRMNVILGDDFAGESFVYTINSQSQTLTRTTPGGIDQQIWGAIQNEYQIQVETVVPNTLAGLYTFEVECLSNKAIELAFCGISDLFITTQRCQFQCGDCLDYSSCISDISPLTSNFDPVTKACQNGYFKDYVNNKCDQCARENCQECTDKYNCTLCKPTFAVTQNGECKCLQNQVILFGQCKDCHSRCKSCFSDTKQGCLQCYNEQNRYLSNSACICLPYFQEVEEDECQPICGDLYVVGQEQCDDGNSIRFDGCHNCKYECQEECKECYFGQCLICSQGYSLNSVTRKCQQIEAQPEYTLTLANSANCGNGQLEGDEQCEDGNLDAFDGCFNCQYSCAEHCQTCTYDICYGCKQDYVLEYSSQSCVKVQAKSISIENFQKQCDDHNLIPFDGCFNQQYSCQEQCFSCINGICTQCQSGYKWDFVTCKEENQKPSLIYLIKQQCQDDNLIPFDGCFDRQEDETSNKSCPSTCMECVRGQCLRCYSEFNLQLDEFSNQCFFDCQFEANSLGFLNLNEVNYKNCSLKCPQYCSNCAFGQCVECNLGYSQNDGECSSICGDGVINGFEECDDRNSQRFDGCYHGIVECTEECQISSAGTCYSCNLGWSLNSITGICETFCGDGLVKGAEFCDDGNDIPYDGCYECNYQCQEECEYCYFGVCYQCQQGFQSINQKCQPICGDGIVIGVEACDDANDVPYDGCFECQYQCQKECLSCYEGGCFECQDGYILSGEVCSSFCGDGLIAYGQEECDDFNNSDGDGCSQNCLMEPGWYCSSTGCTIADSPLMYLDVVSEGNQIKLVNIQFTQKLIATTLQVEFIIKLNSNELPQDDQSYTLEISPLISPSLFVEKEVIYQVTIVYLKNCYVSELEVEIVDQNDLINHKNQPIGNKLVKAKLKPTNFLDETQKKVSSSINGIVNSFFYGIIVVSGVSILTGNLNIMWNTLDLLQFFSYLKYINVPFPLNLEQFFYIFDQMSLEPVLDFIGFNSLLSLLYGPNMVYIQPSKRFADDEINALFMDNISSIAFVFIFGFILYYFEQWLLHLIKQIHLAYYLPSKKFNIIKFILFLKEELHLEIESFYYSEILRIFISSSYEIYFSIYLQFSSFKLIESLNYQSSPTSNNSNFIVFNLALSCFCFLIVNFITISVLFVHQYKEKQFQQPRLKQFQSLYEDINKHSYLSQIFNSLCLVRRSSFMFLLVFTQNAPLLQPLLIGFNSSMFAFYLFLCHPQENHFDDFNQKLMEFTVQFCCFFFFLFEININHYQFYGYQQYQTFGWICIGLISTCIISEFLCDLYQQVAYLKMKFIKFYEQAHPQENNIHFYYGSQKESKNILFD